MICMGEEAWDFIFCAGQRLNRKKIGFNGMGWSDFCNCQDALASGIILD
jgi:hypothetical protein